MASERSPGRQMSLQAMARLLKRRRDTVSRWLSEGCPAVSEGDPAQGLEWKLDPAAVVSWLLSRERQAERARLEAKHERELEALRAALRQVGDDEGVISHAEARRREAVARAKLSELDLAARADELMHVDVADANQIALASVTRTHILGVEHKLAPIVAPITNVGECGAAIRDALYAALHELADVEEGRGGELEAWREDDGTITYEIRVPPRNPDGTPRTDTEEAA